MADTISSLTNRLKNGENNLSKMRETILRPFQLTAAELRDICKKAPNHDRVKSSFANATDAMPDETVLIVDRRHLEEVLEFIKSGGKNTIIETIEEVPES